MRWGDQVREKRVSRLVNSLIGADKLVLACVVGGGEYRDGVPVRYLTHRSLDGDRGIGHPHAGTARRGTDADALARRHTIPAGEETDREVDHVIELPRFDQAIMIEHSSIGRL